MSLFKKSIASLPLLFCLSQANAAVVFDFLELTDTTTGEITGTMANGTAHTLGNSGERAFQSFDWSKGGINLNASASYTGTNTYSSSYTGAYSSGDTLKAWAYLDQGNAGLGVCSKGLATQSSKGTNQCNPGSDDNVTVDEILELVFNQTVSIDFSQSTLRNGGHGIYTIPEPYIDISLDGGSNWLVLNRTQTLVSDSFFFRTNDDNHQFYIDSLAVTAVPEPSVIALLGLGLAGLGFSARRRLRK